MRTTRWLWCGCLCLLLTSCGQNGPKPTVHGLWESVEAPENGTLSLNEGGMLRLTVGSLTAYGRFKVIDEGNVEVTMDNPELTAMGPFNGVLPGDGRRAGLRGAPAKPKVEKWKVTLTLTEMTVTDGKNKPVKFKRIGH
jgi:hypothetical protein